MRVLITGASGFIGQALTAQLLERGDEVVHLVRREPDPESNVAEIRWDTTDPDSVDADDIGRIDAAFNFSGATVAKRWSRNYLDIISNSRIVTTKTLVEILRRMASPPNVLVTASGVAIYGDRGDEQLTERSDRGEGILADIAVPWEAATASAEEFGVRSATFRFGMVFAAEDGPLPVLARPFKAGIGGRLGSGRQWTPWIDIDDAVAALIFVAENESLNGPINVVSPGVVRNSELTHAIANTLDKPSFGWMPAIIARFAIGNQIKELAIDSKLVIPEKLLQAGFEFEHRDLTECLEYEFNQASKRETSESNVRARSVSAEPEIRTPELDRASEEVAEPAAPKPADIRVWGKRKWLPRSVKPPRNRKRLKWRPKDASTIRSRQKR